MEEEIIKLTNLMRSSNDPFWVRLRILLKQNNVNPKTTILAISHEDGECFEFGILVLASGEIIQYGISYLDKQIEEAKITEWNKLSEVNYEEIKVAQSMLKIA